MMMDLIVASLHIIGIVVVHGCLYLVVRGATWRVLWIGDAANKSTCHASCLTAESSWTEAIGAMRTDLELDASIALDCIHGVAQWPVHFTRLYEHPITKIKKQHQDSRRCHQPHFL